MIQLCPEARLIVPDFTISDCGLILTPVLSLSVFCHHQDRMGCQEMLHVEKEKTKESDQKGVLHELPYNFIYDETPPSLIAT